MSMSSSDAASYTYGKLEELYEQDEIIGNPMIQVLQDALYTEFEKHTVVYNGAAEWDQQLIIPPMLDLSGLGDPVAINATYLATQIANFWALALAPTGMMLSGCMVVSSINTAPTIIPTLTAAILALADNQESTPYYEKFYDTIFEQIGLIIYTITTYIEETCSNVLVTNVK